MLEVEPGSGLIKFMRALGRWVRSFRRSKPKGMAGEGRVGSRDEVGKGCGAKGDAHSERCKRVVLGPAGFRIIDDTRQKPHGFIGIVYNNLSAGKTMIYFITNSRRSCPGGAGSHHALSKIT